MKKTLLATSSLALVLAMPLAANAVTLNLGGDLGANADVSANTDMNVATDESGVIKTFGTTQAELDAVASVDATSKVMVVGIGSVSDDAWMKAKSDNAKATADLQAAINANADLKASLQDKKIDVSSIVAADLAADGSLVLYTAS
jgi:hypothetical protein